MHGRVCVCSGDKYMISVGLPGRFVMSTCHRLLGSFPKHRLLRQTDEKYSAEEIFKNWIHLVGFGDALKVQI